MTQMKNISGTVKHVCDQVNDAHEIKQQIAALLGKNVDDILIVGTQSDRIILILDEIRERCVGVSLNGPISSSSFYERYSANAQVMDPEATSSEITFENGLEELQRPKVEMVALYHPENFPLPRFQLGISDIASSVRANLIGQVGLTDMQLGQDIEDISARVETERPDVIGISATFGQQDKLEELIESIQAIDGYTPLVVFGGSLSVLNAEYLIKMYPSAFVAMGYGETTMSDVIKYWHGFIGKEDINNIAYPEEGQIVRTNSHTDDKLSAVPPELDLLDKTLNMQGVMQLEASRGCTYSCSFCPRGHKGLWASTQENAFESTVTEVGKVFDRHPEIARKIFLVDEEFLGYSSDDSSLQRAKEIAATLETYGFRFESSTRMDQVHRNNKGGEWHAERIEFWRYLSQHGLDKMLFGMESGVDNVLKRFNKRTTSEQNVLGVRTLTSCGVPLRLSYITFDPLMNMDELIDTYKFQGRTDVIMQQNDDISAEEMFTAIQNDSYIQTHKKGEPLYREIPYMLVSMECLLGSPYLTEVEKLDLAGEFNMNMGKRDTEYLDDDISVMSVCSQMWIDRNFSLDYLLKSLIKISPKADRKLFYELRVALKDSSYELLGSMLAVVNDRDDLLPQDSEFDINLLKERWKNCKDKEAKRATIISILDEHFSQLKLRFKALTETILPNLKPDHVEQINALMTEWSDRTAWTLINS